MGDVKVDVETQKSDVLVQESQEKPNDIFDEVRSQAHVPSSDSTVYGAPSERTSRVEGGVIASDGFGIEGTLTKGALDGMPERADVKILPSLAKPFDAEKLADEIEEACNGGILFGAGTDEDRIMNALKGLTPEQIAQVDNKFAEKHGVKYAADGQRWGLQEEFRNEMGGSYLDRHLAVLNQKNEIPTERAVAGESLLKDGSQLKAGEINRVTFEDGRKYDVYIPKNAQQPLPVMMLLHGASNGNDMSEMRIMERETGMNSVAEQYGFAVVYPYSQPRSVTGMLGMVQEPASWNIQGNKNFLKEDSSYDDAKFFDRVIADVGARVQTDPDRIGIAGMSDGGRAAQQYALERPGKINALVAQQGTWMDGNKRPEAGSGLPTMLVNSTRDYMLPDDQGEKGLFGEKGRGMMSWIASSFIEGTKDSRPNQQLGVFKDANQCAGEAIKETLGSLEITNFSADQCAKGEVKQFSVKGGNHAWHDWRNEGGWYVVGMPDRTQNMSEETAKWILNHPLKRSF